MCGWLLLLYFHSLNPLWLNHETGGGRGRGNGGGGGGASLVITNISGEVVGATITAFSASSVFSTLAFSYRLYIAQEKRLGKEMNIFLGGKLY